MKARWVLVGGLALGLLFQPVADLARPTIPVFIALLLCVASFRIGPEGLRGTRETLGTHIKISLWCQLFLPVVLIALCVVAGLEGVFVTALLLVAAAAPISGSPNLVIMLGFNPAVALRQLIIGTALLPLTVLPVFFYIPQMGNIADVALATTKLLIVILGAALFGLLLRKLPRYVTLDGESIEIVDGISAILMALVVVGLMSAIGNAFFNSPMHLFGFLVFAFALNLGFQVFGSLIWGRWYGQAYDVPMSVISGNRNVALYLTALPVGVTEPLLVFIGCYQFPMYLTPMIMDRFYRRRRR